MKRCSKCGIDKPESEFYKNASKHDGLQAYCRSCHWDYRRAHPSSKEAATAAAWRYRQRHSGKVNATRRKHRKANLHKYRQRQLAWRKKNALKCRACRVLQQAVKMGSIIKPSRCERCGQKVPVRRLHGHHDDYAKPLVVRWLCHGCHMDLHYSQRATLRETEQ